MPELPEVETVKNGLIPHLTGQQILHIDQRRANLRYPFPEKFSSRLEKREILSLQRRAKYLLIELQGGLVWMIHLGMSGRFTINEKPDRAGSGHNSGRALLDKHDHLIVTLGNGARLVYNDPRRFGFMALIERARLNENPHLAGLGPEPLGPDFTSAYIGARLKNKKTPIKTALLNQKLVAGLGNIYVCEALWRAGISPKRQAGRISKTKFDKLVPAIQKTLEDAILSGGSSLRDFVNAEGELGYFQHRWAVYGREGERCDKIGCDGLVKRIIQSGRSSFYCPRHQK